MNQISSKVDVITNDGRGNRPTAPQEFMNSLVRTLIKLGILKEDLDYHLIRASMVIIFLFFGYQKWWAYEAQRLIPISAMARSSFGCIRFSASAEPVGSREL
jgi:hypothetical protein